MKGKKTIIVILATMLALSIPAAFSKNDNFSVDYTFELTPGDCGEYTVKDTQLQDISGEPLIPYKAAQILLPQEAVVKDVKVKTGMPIIEEGIEIPWGQPPCTFSDTPVKVGKNEATYGSDNAYPGKMFEILGVDYCRGFSILSVNLYPVQYKPKSGTIHFYQTMTVEVKLAKGVKNELYRGLPEDKQEVSIMVDNPEMVATYEDGPVPLATEQYIIITNDTLQSTFQTLATHKANYLTGATVYTVSWIIANYSGRDNQEKIRTFIKDKYTNNGTLYVLLGGDIAVVPYRGFYVSSGGYTDTDMLADMYYGHLDGTFNSDNDSLWAEPNDGVDWYAEVAVGRAPCENVTEASNFVNKVKNYELATKPTRVLLHQSRVLAGNVPDSRCLAYNCDNWIPGGYTIQYLFEETATVTKSSWISAWAQNPVAVAHIGHGNTTVYYINYERGGTISWYNSDVASMTNTFWPWTTSVACICGQIEADDCLAEAYVMDSNNGAIAAIYNDNYGWFSTSNACKYSGEFCEKEFRACWSDGKQKLGDMLNKARSYLVSSASSNSTYRWCFYERNLVGDPESPCLAKRKLVYITNPHNWTSVSGNVSITASTAGNVNTVEFYIDSTLVYTDTAAPYEYVWNTNLYSDGSHTIEVKGYASGVYKDNDLITVSVSNDTYIVILTPHDWAMVVGSVLITVDASEDIDTVTFYIDYQLEYIDTDPPFQYMWNTMSYSDGDHTITVDGWDGSIFKTTDSITVTVMNNPMPFLFPLLSFLPIGIIIKRR